MKLFVRNLKKIGLINVFWPFLWQLRHSGNHKIFELVAQNNSTQPEARSTWIHQRNKHVHDNGEKSHASVNSMNGGSLTWPWVRAGRGAGVPAAAAGAAGVAALWAAEPVLLLPLGLRPQPRPTRRVHVFHVHHDVLVLGGFPLRIIFIVTCIVIVFKILPFIIKISVWFRSILMTVGRTARNCHGSCWTVAGCKFWISGVEDVLGFICC